MKHPTPPAIKQYYEHFGRRPPECCHTCDFYQDDGVCSVFNMTPPEDFARSEGECPEWVELIPF